MLYSTCLYELHVLGKKSVFPIETFNLQKGNKDFFLKKENNKYVLLVFYLANFRCSDQYDHMHLKQLR